jgi:Protein of unknown function (DUF2281)
VSTVQLIEQKAKTLPDDLQVEVLHYIEFLLARQHAGTESAEWGKFSAAQLEKQYGQVDAVYDRKAALRTWQAIGPVNLARRR